MEILQRGFQTFRITSKLKATDLVKSVVQCELNTAVSAPIHKNDFLSKLLLCFSPLVASCVFFHLLTSPSTSSSTIAQVKLLLCLWFCLLPRAPLHKHILEQLSKMGVSARMVRTPNQSSSPYAAAQAIKSNARYLEIEEGSTLT